MKLKEKQRHVAHSDIVNSVTWNQANELFSCSDDKTISKWDKDGEPSGQNIQLDEYITALHWSPNAKRGQAETLAAACSDGTFMLLSKALRVEKKVEGHSGACTSLKWDYEGTALVTAGEDGSIKIWSRQGMLRSQLATMDNPVYHVCWAYDNNQVLICSGQNLAIKHLQQASKSRQWQAHDACVLEADWSPINCNIVSVGEDCKYKIWDYYGRLKFQSSPLTSMTMSVSWSPVGDNFAVGLYNEVLLCDRSGWIEYKEDLKGGSVLSTSWAHDGMQIATAGATGQVWVGQLLDVQVEEGNIVAKVTSTHEVTIEDLVAERTDCLDYRDRVTKISLGYNHLVVVTPSQCHVYKYSNLSLPHLLDLQEPVHIVLQSQNLFALVYVSNGIQVYTYDGKHVSSPKWEGLYLQLLSGDEIDITNDTLAVLDQTTNQAIRFFDSAQGKPTSERLVHNVDITHVKLNSNGTQLDRRVAFLDRNSELYICPVYGHKPNLVFKLATMTTSIRWHSHADILGAISDEKLTLWYGTSVIYVDKDLIHYIRECKRESDLGKAGQVVGLTGTSCRLRRVDGTRLHAEVSPFPLKLFQLIAENQWESALKMCRFVQDNCSWTILAVEAIKKQNLKTAEAALAALHQVDKLRYILHIKSIKSYEVRSAALSLFCRQPEEGEQILLQAGFIYRAIKLNIDLHRWNRALEIAQSYNMHVDTVLWKRQKHLSGAGLKETKKEFSNLSGIELDVDAIQSRIRDEKSREAVKQTKGSKR